MTQQFLLDESLVPRVAEALRLVGYRIDDVVSVFRRRGVTDPEIIDWCEANDALWINADDRARKQHKAKLRASGVHTLWIRRPRGQMTGREQLRIISCALPKMIDKLARDGLNKSVDYSSTHRKLSRADGLFRVSLVRTRDTTMPFPRVNCRVSEFIQPSWISAPLIHMTWPSPPAGRPIETR